MVISTKASCASIISLKLFSLAYQEGVSQTNSSHLPIKRERRKSDKLKRSISLAISCAIESDEAGAARANANDLSLVVNLA